MGSRDETLLPESCSGPALWRIHRLVLSIVWLLDLPRVLPLSLLSLPTLKCNHGLDIMDARFPARRAAFTLLDLKRRKLPLQAIGASVRLHARIDAGEPLRPPPATSIALLLHVLVLRLRTNFLLLLHLCYNISIK